MDLLIPDSWLRKYLDTKATHIEIAKYLSLCGPSIERTNKTNDGDFIYNVEVTTNRIDTASVLGIAREASAILPRFGIPAKIIFPKLSTEKNHKFVKKVKYLNAVVDQKLCSRFTAVLIKNVSVKESPQPIKTLLEKIGVRPINNIVDVSNYIMHELGQPVHTFDFDKIESGKMTLRESKKDEVVKTLDGKEFKLNGGDIVIEGANGNLIDLCGIMGGENSAIDSTTKNVLLFVQNYDQHKIRKTSMSLGQRTEAAVLFEKGIDSEGVKPAILKALELIEKLSGGTSETEILDIYPSPYKTKMVSTTKEELDNIIGVNIGEKDIINYLTALGFEVNWSKKKLNVKIPSWRASDMDIREDIAEEIARIYGYHNLPSVLMSGNLPSPRPNNQFAIEKKIKETLVSIGATEVYNLSLVEKGDLKLKNPLGPDTAYLRNNLKDSLIKNIDDNPQEKGKLHFFEVSNVYQPQKNELPVEKLVLAGVIKNGSYRENKGIVGMLLDTLGIDFKTKIEEGNGYLPNQRLVVLSDKKIIGEYGNLENKLSNGINSIFFYEFTIELLLNAKKLVKKYKEINKYPPQVEDLTLILPEKTFVGDVVSIVKQTSNLIIIFDLVDIYESNYTFNIQYQAEDRTLNDSEVEKIRSNVLTSLKSKFGISIKI